MYSIYAASSYKEFLKSRAAISRGLLTSLAKAARCELSYLSRVLSTEAHITPDQAYNIATRLDLDARERDFFQLLVDFERAGDTKFKGYLEKKMNLIRQENENLSLRTRRPIATLEQKEFIYHSSWIYCAVHIATSIPEFQNANSLARKLNLPIEVIEQTLQFLIDHEYVNKSHDGFFKFKNHPTHTPKDSVLVPLHHNNWRQRGYLDSLNFQTDSLHYTIVQSLSKTDFIRVKNLILKVIEDYEKIAEPSDCEELINLNIDIYKV